MVENRKHTDAQKRVAYFSMEIGLESDLPSYSGGLGVLAGDTIRSASDAALPMVAMTLLHRKGYFKQAIEATKGQVEQAPAWRLEEFLKEENPRVSVTIEQRTVTLRCYRYDAVGVTGAIVPVYFLDVSLDENDEADRTLTDHLYGGDSRYRICQEIILGIGGVRMLRALGHTALEKFHMNEGHASFLTLELLKEETEKAGVKKANQKVIDTVRSKCIFTTHTPVAAGHDQFGLSLVTQTLGDVEAYFDVSDKAIAELYKKTLKHPVKAVEKKPAAKDAKEKPEEPILNMTYLALNLSCYVNGVARKHGEVSREMFPNYKIDFITNGIHTITWAAEPLKKLFDKYCPGWKEENSMLRDATLIPDADLWEAHTKAKGQLLDYIKAQGQGSFDPEVLTLGFARRFTGYKRANLLFSDIERLQKIAKQGKKLQVVFAGKAHPKDLEGKALIQSVLEAQAELGDDIKIVFLSNYEMRQGLLITAGVDVWLNNPKRPLEASGTSGMKAALNGVPSLSILDGWWIEGWIEDLTGWAIGGTGVNGTDEEIAKKDAEALYTTLEKKVIPSYYDRRADFIKIMRHSIALNGSQFNTQRMVEQYVARAYFRPITN